MATRIVQLDDPTGAHKRAPRGDSQPSFQAPPRTDKSVPSLTGILGPGQGARLLMDLFVDEKSGRLILDAAPGPRGSLFFLAGEPVHAMATNGADALEKRLAARGVLRTAPVGVAAPAGLAALWRRSHPVAVLEALRDEVRDFAAQLLSSSFGEWAFWDDDLFAEHTPLTAVNPFGFALEAHRRALAPDALLRLGEELATRFPEPRAGFANVAPRLRPFTGGLDLSFLVDGQHSGAEIYEATRLDPIMGGLVLRTLADTGLVDLAAARRASSMIDRRKRANASVLPALVDARQLSQLSSSPGRGGVEILSLYLDIKPLRKDDAILGVEGQASPSAIERAYQQRLAELDPRAISTGANRPYLLARVEELRAKVERAYRAMTSTQSKGAPQAYEILDKIGEGGMAEVFRGRASDDPKKLVAVKRILPKLRDDPEFARQFLDEARLARRIQHPNVVRVLTVGKQGEDLYLAMEFVDGFDLGELLRRAATLGRTVPIVVGCRIVADVAGGLHAAHTAHDRTGAITPILHRDVSTQNILVSKAGDVKLTDFGIAKAMDAHEPNNKEELTGSVKGKVPYLAPELLEGQPASVRSDVYALAMTLYAVLAKLPFVRGNGFATMRAILNDPLPRASSLRAEVPPAVDALLVRAASKNPDERPASAQEFQLELEDALTADGAVDIGAWVRFVAGATPRPMAGVGAPQRVPGEQTKTVTLGTDRSDDAVDSRPAGR